MKVVRSLTAMYYSKDHGKWDYLPWTTLKWMILTATFLLMVSSVSSGVSGIIKVLKVFTNLWLYLVGGVGVQSLFDVMSISPLRV